MEEYIIELKEILFRIESLNKEISNLNILLNEYEKEMFKKHLGLDVNELYEANGCDIAIRKCPNCM